MRGTPPPSTRNGALNAHHQEGQPQDAQGHRRWLAVAIPTVALAASPFDDVDPTAFYADAVEWAFDNNITTGTSATTFEPDANVTRGQNVTFAKRYHDNIAQPEFDAIHAELDALDIPQVQSAWVTPGGSTVGDGTTDGVTSLTTGTGRYVVTFPDDVADCSWSIVHRTRGGSLIPQPDADYTDEPHFELSSLHTGVFPNEVKSPEGIVVLVTDSGGVQRTTDFQVQAIC